MFNVQYCSEKSKSPAPMCTGNLDVVDFTAETSLQWTIGPLSRRGHISYLTKRTCTDYVGQIAYGFRTVSLGRIRVSHGIGGNLPMS